jgi:hypothetical protein
MVNPKMIRWVRYLRDEGRLKGEDYFGDLEIDGRINYILRKYDVKI